MTTGSKNRVRDPCPGASGQVLRGPKILVSRSANLNCGTAHLTGHLAGGRPKGNVVAQVGVESHPRVTRPRADGSPSDSRAMQEDDYILGKSGINLGQLKRVARLYYRNPDAVTGSVSLTESPANRRMIEIRCRDSAL